MVGERLTRGLILRFLISMMAGTDMKISPRSAEPSSESSKAPTGDLAKKVMEEVRLAMSENASVRGWQVTESEARSLQGLYLADATGLSCYQRRHVEDQSVSLLVYVASEDGSLGQGQREIDPMIAVAPQVESAIRSAGLIRNPFFELPRPPAVPYPEVVTSDESIERDMEGAMLQIEERAGQIVRDLHGVNVNSAEIYVNARRSLTTTSTGIVMDRRETDLYFEAAMEKTAGNAISVEANTQEVHRDLRAVTCEGLLAELPAFVQQMREETLALGGTILPPTTEKAMLLVDAGAFSDLVRAVLDQMDAATEYNRLPHLLPGAEIARGEALPDSEPLTVDLDPLLPAMALSTPFTREGLVAQQGRMIESGVVRNQTISHRMGSYLAKSPNGLTGNMVIPCGPLTKEELLASVDECIEVLSFSSLLVNSRSLTWSSEIKLGRLYRRGKLVALVKGGVASGDIRENLTSARYAAHRREFNKIGDSWHGGEGYLGPEAVLLRTGVRIAGA